MHEPGSRQHREGEGLKDRGDEHCPDRHREAKHRHPRGPHENDCRHVVDAPEHRRHPDHRQAKEPKRLPHPAARGRDGARRQRRIARPAPCGRSPLDEETATEEQERRPHEPVAQHVERREGHVIGADHERDQEVAEGSRQNRDDDQEDHHRRVHREQHRIELGGHLPPLLGEELSEDRDVGPRPSHLPADGQGKEPADEKPDKCREQELQPDDLVILREHVGREERRQRHRSAGRPMNVGIVGRGCRRRSVRLGDGAHRCWPLENSPERNCSMAGGCGRWREKNRTVLEGSIGGGHGNLIRATLGRLLLGLDPGQPAVEVGP